MCVSVVPEYKPAASLAFFGAFLANRPYLEYGGRGTAQPMVAVADAAMQRQRSSTTDGESGGDSILVAAAMACMVSAALGWCCGRHRGDSETARKKRAYERIEIE